VVRGERHFYYRNDVTACHLASAIGAKVATSADRLPWCHECVRSSPLFVRLAHIDAAR
jgi:hypothetical protein